MRKTTSLNVNKAKLESGQLEDLLNSKGDMKLGLKYKGKAYGIIDVVSDSGQVILLAELDQKGVSSKYVAKQLKNTLGQDVFVEIDGKIIPADSFTNGTLTASIKKSLIDADSLKTYSTPKEATILSKMVALATKMLNLASPTEHIKRGDSVFNQTLNKIGTVMEVKGDQLTVKTVFGDKLIWSTKEVSPVDND